jgi:hypothetical protein
MRWHHGRIAAFLLCWLAGGAGGDAHAFRLRPEITSNEGVIRRLEVGRMGAFLDRSAKAVAEHFSEPVHEEITHRIFGCTLPDEGCANGDRPASSAPAAVLAGVRWNDNPPFAIDSDTKRSFSSCQYDFTAFRLPNFSKCWIDLFRDAERNAARAHYRGRSTGKQYALIYRVHFGDMQFLHSMASWDGERAWETKARIMMWAEFTYRLATGDGVIHNEELRSVAIAGMDKVFVGLPWSAERLFTLDDTTFRTPEQIRLMALGSLLHMLQDSFSRAHVNRQGSNGQFCADVPGNQLKPGAVEMFYAYNSQDSGKHGTKDARGSGFEPHVRSITPNVVKVGQTILGYFRENKPWKEVRTYVDCLYQLDDPEVPAEAGLDFTKQ